MSDSGGMRSAHAQADPVHEAQLRLEERLAAETRAMGQVIKEIAGDVKDVRERMIALETGREFQIENRSRIRNVEQRVDALEKDKDRRDGALGAASWALRYGPWATLVTILLAAISIWGAVLSG